MRTRPVLPINLMTVMMMRTGAYELSHWASIKAPGPGMILCGIPSCAQSERRERSSFQGWFISNSLSLRCCHHSRGHCI
eukprot:scaffold12763_cov93-Cylindrotheca_fusiformis.AAC.1